MALQFDRRKMLVGFDIDLTLNDHRGEYRGGIYRDGGYDAYRLVACTLMDRYPEAGITPPSDQSLNVSHRTHHSQDDIFKYHFPGIEPGAAREIWDTLDHHNFAVKGAPETIRQLRSDGYPLFILTSKPQPMINQRLDECSISPDNFLFIISTDQEDFQKPDPGVFIELVQPAIQELKGKKVRSLSLRRAVYVGDHPDDYQAAETAGKIIGGPKGIAVPSGYYSKGDLLGYDIPQDDIIDEIAHLPKHLKSLEEAAVV